MTAPTPSARDAHRWATARNRLASTRDSLLEGVGHPAWFALLAIVLQLPLILNVGYFSHDELQWLAFADKPTLAQVPWLHWFDFRPFQYRPLTFNLWLLLSHCFGYHPILMHLLRVLAGLGVAMLLRRVLIAFGASAQAAGVGVALFLLLPEVVYTHGWVGTYADSLCAIFALAAIWWTLRLDGHSARPGRFAGLALGVMACTAAALMSKESAVVLPVLLAASVYRCSRRVALGACVAAAIVVAFYLYLRIHVILLSPHEHEGYAWSLRNIPARLIEYASFPFLWHRFEITSIAVRRLPPFAVLCWIVYLLAMATAGRRTIAVLVIGWAAALGPVLILGHGANHYAYLACIFLCGMTTLAWADLGRKARIAVGFCIALACLHGINEMIEIRHVGLAQRNLYRQLPTLVQQHPGTLHIKPQNARDEFIVFRLLRDIPSYHHVALGDRVAAVRFSDASQSADYLMTHDGHLVAAQ